MITSKKTSYNVLKTLAAILIVTNITLGSLTSVSAETLDNSGSYVTTQSEIDNSQYENEDTQGTEEIRLDTSKYDAYSSRYYYNKLNSEQKRIYNEWLKQCNRLLVGGNINLEKDADCNAYYLDPIEFSNISDEKVTETYDLFKMDNPQFFFISNYMVVVSIDGVPVQAAVCICKSSANGKTRIKTRDTIFKTLNKWQKKIDRCKTKKAKLRKIHDLIIENTKYDTRIATKLDSNGIEETQNITKMFTKNKALCYGYAAAFSMMCNYNNIKSVMVTSDTHAWNMVKYKGKWSYIDTTWDDIDIDGLLTYRYFLNTSKKLKADDSDNEHTVSKWLRKYIK